MAVSSSVALLADTVHDFSDALTAIPPWIALSLGARAATRRYTFGDARAEDLVILLMILGSAVLVRYQSIPRLIDPAPIATRPPCPARDYPLPAASRISTGREDPDGCVQQGHRPRICRGHVEPA